MAVVQRQRTLLLWLILAAFVVRLPQSAIAESADVYADRRARTALLIGLSAYISAPLKNPVADAELIGTRLEAAGFQVSRLIDASAHEIGPAIASFKAASRGADIALIYYAGHGLQVDSENFIVPVDFDPVAADALAALFPIRALLAEFDKLAKARVLLLDACRNNPFGAALKARGTQVSGDGLAPIELPVQDAGRWPQGTSGLLVGYATQPSLTALDGDGKNSPYATALANALANPDADFEAILKRTTGAVKAATHGKQHPEFRSALTGPLYLVARTEPLACDLLAGDTDNDVSLKGVPLEEIDHERAIPACQEALNGQPGSPRLMHNLGRALEKASRFEEALAQYLRAAELGYDPAQLYYGNSLMEGLAGEIDMKTGLAWLRKAYEQGNRQALINYAAYDLSPFFDRPNRVRALQAALRAGVANDLPDTGLMDDATKLALDTYKRQAGIEAPGINFQILDRLDLVETLFPKTRIQGWGQ